MSPPVPVPPPPDPLAAEDLAAWPDHLAEVAARLQPVCPDPRTHRRALAYLEGLLGTAPRKNSWQLAEGQGAANPYGFQHLLGRAAWSPEAARDALYAYVKAHLGHADGVGIIDETGFLKQGTHSAGVARQYSGTAGRIANCQVGVFLDYAGPGGHTLVDRELYLPEGWTNEPARLQAVGLAPDTPFATKPQLARRLLARALDAGLPLAWVTGDSVYGHSSGLRQWLEARGQSYVLAVPANEHVWVGFRQVPVGDVQAQLPDADWETLACGLGAKGPRRYDWQCRVLAEPEDADWGRYVLFRRACADPDDAQAYFVYAAQRQACTLETLVRVAGTRWCIERAFEDAKQETGLDEYEVRSATGWYRHMTLALWALALLAVLRATTLPDAVPPVKKNPAAAWRPSNGPAGWGRAEPGGRPPTAVGAVATHHPRPAPLAGLAGLEAPPRLDGPVLPLPAAGAAS